MSQDEHWRKAYSKLDEAATELFRLLERDTDNPGDPPAIPTDYVLVVGSMYIDSDGDRCGITSHFPKDGSQPVYVTDGLLSQALAHLRR
ncbi:hypothetical protein EV580_1330 [Mycobacterium sp. BK086]|uniref:DUF7213 family protein n=1 Tax=Mycobacterium sp. BK086 TaxID=2512165 RepID=UPI00105EE5F9|nr:hypothetical protein [Mycobacterium sp. BK086]TDO18148.1 hypothetical protein EV580_1330 [Mycobacterium sp. BK086]